MKRAELEQVRIALNRIGEYVDQMHVHLPTSLHKAEAMGECAAAATALALLDAELAKPEAREYRLTYETNTGKCADGTWDSEADALKVKDLLVPLPKIFSNIAIEVRVKGTPAGPWERAE